jgi:hypothetical protein
MDTRCYDLHGIRVAELAREGTPLQNDRDAVDAIASVSAHNAEIIVIPTERLDEDFFRLRTGIAGQVIQKFLTYRFRLVIMGDISERLRESSALRDFVYECNTSSDIWFVTRLDELNQRLLSQANAQ